jgi:hypothetical protein
MSLPHESNYSKSVEELVHELEINHERVNASGEATRKMYLENERRHALRVSEMIDATWDLTVIGEANPKVTTLVNLKDETIYMRTEQRRNWEQYQIAIKERNEFEAELKKVHQNHEGIVCLRNERNRAIAERDEARALAVRRLVELAPLRRLREAMQKLLGCALTTTGCGSDEDSAQLSDEELAECNDMGGDDDE